jgi:hypothetical protein
MRARPLYLLLALGGCRSGLLDGDAGAPAGDGGARRDFAAGSCASHQLQTVPLDGIQVLDGQPRLGAAVRVQLTYLRKPCDVPGAITVDFQAGDATDRAVFTAHLWASDQTACGAPVSERRVIALSDVAPVSSPILILSDGAGPVSTKVGLLPPSSQDCFQPVMLGSICQLDCQCQLAFQPARCIPISDSDGRCAVSCSEDVDCPDDIPRCGAGQSVRSACGGGGPCQGDGECPFGQRCTQVPQSERACRPAQPLPVGGCSCDGDCPFGSVCAKPAGADGHCVAPCAQDTDCAPTTSPRGQGQCDPGSSACNTLG